MTFVGLSVYHNFRDRVQKNKPPYLEFHSVPRRPKERYARCPRLGRVCARKTQGCILSFLFQQPENALTVGYLFETVLCL